MTNLMESDLQKIISSTQPLTDQHYHYFLYQVRVLLLPVCFPSRVCLFLLLFSVGHM